MKVFKSNIRDKSKPVDISHLIIDEDDCFGNEWENTSKICAKCSEYETCMVLFLSKNNHRVDDIRKKSKNFFDELDWDNVPWTEIFEQIVLNPGEISLQDLRFTVKKLSKCIDDFTLNSKVQNWLIENNIKVKKGCLYSY